MEVNNLLNNELPFLNLSDDSFHSFLSIPTLFNAVIHSDFEFDPFNIDDCKYNKDLDVNEFYLRNRSTTVPKTEYIFLDNISYLKRNTLTISNMNIRSIPKNLQCFREFILDISHINFSVLGFTETRLEPHLSSLYGLTGYSLYANSRNTHGGGVALYVSTDYESTVINQFTLSDPSIESIGVESIMTGKSVLFLCIYRPPSGNFNSFITGLSGILSSMCDKKYGGVYIFGDFNLDLMKTNDNNVFEFINLMYSFSLFPFITKPTRVTNTSATLIDHIWSTQIEENIGNYIIQTDITDHFPTVSQFSLEYPKPETQFTYKRNITANSLEHFKDDLALLDWNQVLSFTNSNEAYTLFYNEFHKLFQKHFPLRKTRLDKKSEINPHITPALKTSIKERNRLERLAKKWPLTYRVTYKQYRNKLTSILRSAKNIYYKNQLKDNQGNPKKHWNTRNTLLGRTSCLSNQTIKFDPPCTDIPTKFNEHFLKDIPGRNYANNEYLKYLNNSPSFSMYLTPTNITEVERNLSLLK